MTNVDSMSVCFLTSPLKNSEDRDDSEHIYPPLETIEQLKHSFIIHEIKTHDLLLT